MSHARQQIREALAVVVNNLGTTEDRVYQTPVYPSGDSQLPGLCLFTLDDRCARRGDRKRRLEWWELQVEIQARAKPPDGTTIDDQLDAIDLEVTAAIAGDLTLGGLVRGLKKTSVQMAVAGELERPVGVARIRYTCRYLIDPTKPETILTGAEA